MAYFHFLTIKNCNLSADGPMVDKHMTLSLLSSRDTETNIMFTLSFIVSYGPPSMISCVHGNNIQLFMSTASRGTEIANLSREVIRSHYINSSHPDMTHVSITVTQPRVQRTYTCTVTVEGRVNIDNDMTYYFENKGTGSSTASISSK